MKGLAKAGFLEIFLTTSQSHVAFHVGPGTKIKEK